MIEFDTVKLDAPTNGLKEDKTMVNEKIGELYDEIENYKQAIYDAKGALASAEEELDQLLAAEYEKQNQ